MNTSSNHSKTSGVWIPTRSPCHDANPLTPTPLTCRVIPSNKNQANDLLNWLNKTGLNRFYQNYIKRYSLARFIVLWVWRHGFPVYITYLHYLLKKESRIWWSLIQFSTVAKASPEDRYFLVDQSIVKSSIPTVFPAKNQHYLDSQQAQYIFPELFVTTVQNALVSGGTNLILMGDQVLCHDLYDFNQDYTSEELHGRVVINPKTKSIRWLLHDDKPVAIPVAAAFVDACASNYAHWLTEVLPRICLFCADSRFEGVPIIINDGLHSNLIASLFLVTGDREIIALPIGRALSVERLYLTSPTGYIPFEKRPRKFTTPPSHGKFSAYAFNLLRERLGVKLSVSHRPNFPKKIYLRRRSSIRRLINESEIEALLVTRGFVIVETEHLDFAEQVILFQNADIIIGPTGAACANLIFSNPDASVVILMGVHENMPYRYWLNMASAAGIKSINYILGDIVENKSLSFHGDYTIDTNDLHAYLNTMGELLPLIHPTACVSHLAKLGTQIDVGAFTIIHDNVVIGDRVKIGAYCELGIPTPLGDGSPLIISNDSVIRSHSIFYESSLFGLGLVTGHHVTVRENTKAGESFQIGTYCEIQGDCDIGNFVRFQSNVFVSKKTKIGNYVWVLPYVVFTNDPTPPSNQMIGCIIEDFASICASSTILPGITVGQYSLVAAGACVTKNVPAHMAVAGVPAKVTGEAKSILRRDGSGEPAYPWKTHFNRGYPDAVIDTWKT